MLSQDLPEVLSQTRLPVAILRELSRPHGEQQGADPSWTISFIADYLEDPTVIEFNCKPTDYLTTYLNCNLTYLIVDMSICCTLKFVEA